MKSRFIGILTALVLFSVSASLAESQSVHSQNIVGAMRLVLPPGLSMISTPFQAVGSDAETPTPQTIDEILGSDLPEQMQAFIYNADQSSYRNFVFFSGVWRDGQTFQPAGNTPVPRGQGLWVLNVLQEPISLGITGEVPTRQMEVIPVIPGIQMVSFSFPATVDEFAAGLEPANGDQIFTFGLDQTYKGFVYWAGQWRNNQTFQAANPFPNPDDETSMEWNLRPGTSFWYESTASTQAEWVQLRPYNTDNQ